MKSIALTSQLRQLGGRREEGGSKVPGSEGQVGYGHLN